MKCTDETPLKKRYVNEIRSSWMKNQNFISKLIIESLVNADPKIEAIQKASKNLKVQYINVRGHVTIINDNNLTKTDLCNTVFITRSLFQLSEKQLSILYDKINARE